MARRGLLGALAIFVALACWAIASPVGASPDEDFHLVSVWCAHGDRTGACEPGDTATTRRVPAILLRQACYRFEPTQSAACQTAPPVPSGMVDTGRGNFVGDYPPIFYFVQGFFVGPDIPRSVVLMRLANALLSVALISAIYLLLPAGLRRPLIGAALLTAVPLGMFLVPSINPSSWALLCAATLLVSLLGYVAADDRRRRVGLGALAALSLLLGVGARADAASYAIVAIGAVVILTFRRDAATMRRLIYPASLAVIAAAAFVSVGQSSAVAPVSATGQSFSLGRLVHTALDIPALWIGGVGAQSPHKHNEAAWAWGLGWLDTAMPAVVWVGMWGAFAAVLFVAAAGAGLRRGLAIGAVALAAFLVPTYIQYLQDTPVGGLVQPRYILPLLTMLAAVAMTRLRGAAFRLTSGQRWTVVAVLSVANAVALHTNLQRYVSGTDATTLNLNRDVEWWWSIAVSPMVVVVLGSVAFAAGAVLLTKDFVVTSAATDQPTVDAGASSSVHSGQTSRSTDGDAPKETVEVATT